MKNNSHTGMGIAIGASLGLLFGLLWDGNIAWGLSIGICLGLVFGAIQDGRSAKKP